MKGKQSVKDPTEIRAGTYFIPKGAGYEEIARIITGRD